jgi:hypothetical protein
MTPPPRQETAVFKYRLLLKKYKTVFRREMIAERIELRERIVSCVDCVLC